MAGENRQAREDQEDSLETRQEQADDAEEHQPEAEEPLERPAHPPYLGQALPARPSGSKVPS